MTTQNSQQRRHERAWQALGWVENHPQVEVWLKDADQQFATKLAFAKCSVWRSMRRSWVAAASILLVVIGVGVEYRHSAPQHYETGIGEQRDVLLVDGSRIILNTNTSVYVRYSKERRYLVLERGEALFSVAHNAARPFDVEAAGTLTRAIGTEFNVDMSSANVTVSVLEGVVQVSTPDSSVDGRPSVADISAATHPRAEAIAKGQAIEFRPTEHRLVPEKANLGRIDAWRTRRIEFSNTPLAEAVEEFNRYSSTRIVIGSRSLADRRVSGVFHISDKKGFIYSLHEALGVEAHSSLNEVVLIQSAN